MHKVIVLTITLLLLSFPLMTQTNLIPNPNFDKKKPGVDCTYQYSRGLLEDFIEDWYAYYNSGNILFESCIGIAYNTLHTRPKKGNGFLYGLYDTSPNFGLGTGERTYFQVQLKEKLVPGKNYYLEYYYQTRINSFPIAYHGLHFTDTLEVNGSRGIPFRRLEIDSPHLELDTIPHDHVIGEWQAIHHCFTVDDEYSVMIGGVLRPRSFIHPFMPEGHHNHVALYFYDAFYLIEVEDTLYLDIEERIDTICVGECITLSTNHSRIPGTFLWDLPGSNLGQSSDSVVRVCYAEPGIYDVGITVEHCHGRHQEEWIDRVVVVERPDAEDNRVQHHQLLLGETLELPACAGDDWEYLWQEHEFLDCTDCPNPIFFAYSDAELMAVAAPNSPCPDTCFHSIQVLSPVLAAFQADASILCEGDCFTLTNNSRHYDRPIEYRINGEQFFWPENESSLTICPDEPGIYDLMFIAQNDLSVDTAFLSFEIVPYPEPAEVETFYDLEFGEEVMLSPGLVGQHYLWEAIPDDHILINCPDCSHPIITGLQSAEINLTVSNEDCTDHLSYQIAVAKQEPQIYIPNSFSPNGDGVNDVFQAEGQYFVIRSLKIYDRYGAKIHEDFSPNASWDGNFKGREMGVGTYVYLMEYEDIYGEVFFASGELLLLR